MITFAPLITSRFRVQLKELSIGGAIALCSIPDHLIERGNSEFLGRVIDSLEPQIEGEAIGIKTLTVQERMLIVGHYLAHVNEVAVDFPVGGGKYSDYLIDADCPANYPFELGEAAGDRWFISPLLGGAAEAIEMLNGSSGASGSYHWFTGCMAAQLSLDGDSPAPSVNNYSAYSEWLKARIQVFTNYPESKYIELLNLFLSGREMLTHFFNIGVDADGLVALPKKEAGDNSPVRFPVRTCIHEVTKRMAGKFEREPS